MLCARRVEDRSLLRLALVDFYAPSHGSDCGRSLRLGALDSADYPVQLAEIKCKLVTAHPNGYMQSPWFGMEYKLVGFHATEDEREVLARGALE